MSLSKVIQGSHHQADLIFFNTVSTPGAQCIPNCLYAIAFTLFQNINKWDEFTINEILLYGIQLYNEICKQNPVVQADNRKLFLEEVPRTFYMNNKKLCWKNSSEINGSMGHAIDPDIHPPLHSTLQDMFKNYSYGVLVIEDAACAVMKLDDKYYCFDPHSRNKNGLFTANGKATRVCCETYEDFVAFLQNLAKSCTSLERDISSFTYALYPILMCDQTQHDQIQDKNKDQKNKLQKCIPKTQRVKKEFKQNLDIDTFSNKINQQKDKSQKYIRKAKCANEKEFKQNLDHIDTSSKKKNQLNTKCSAITVKKYDHEKDISCTSNATHTASQKQKDLASKNNFDSNSNATHRIKKEKLCPTYDSTKCKMQIDTPKQKVTDYKFSFHNQTKEINISKENVSKYPKMFSIQGKSASKRQIPLKSNSADSNDACSVVVDMNLRRSEMKRIRANDLYKNNKEYRERKSNDYKKTKHKAKKTENNNPNISIGASENLLSSYFQDQACKLMNNIEHVQVTSCKQKLPFTNSRQKKINMDQPIHVHETGKVSDKYSCKRKSNSTDTTMNKKSKTENKINVQEPKQKGYNSRKNETHMPPKSDNSCKRIQVSNETHMAPNMEVENSHAQNTRKLNQLKRDREKYQYQNDTEYREKKRAKSLENYHEKVRGKKRASSLGNDRKKRLLNTLRICKSKIMFKKQLII